MQRIDDGWTYRTRSTNSILYAQRATFLVTDLIAWNYFVPLLSLPTD